MKKVVVLLILFFAVVFTTANAFADVGVFSYVDVDGYTKAVDKANQGSFFGLSATTDSTVMKTGVSGLALGQDAFGQGSFGQSAQTVLNTGSGTPWGGSQIQVQKFGTQQTNLWVSGSGPFGLAEVDLYQVNKGSAGSALAIGGGNATLIATSDTVTQKGQLCGVGCFNAAGEQLAFRSTDAAAYAQKGSSWTQSQVHTEAFGLQSLAGKSPGASKSGQNSVSIDTLTATKFQTAPSYTAASGVMSASILTGAKGGASQIALGLVDMGYQTRVQNGATLIQQVGSVQATAASQR